MSDYVKNGIRLRMHSDLFSGVFNFAIIEYRNGKRYLGELVFKESPEGMYCSPTFSVSALDGGPILELVKDLEAAGLTVGEHKGELKATKYHLEDMRLLAKVKAKAHD